MAARELLLDADVRLLTLTGAPGIGKTRLALELAASLRRQFDRGACFVDLAMIADPMLVVPAIARSLGVRQVPGQPLFETLKHALAQQLLLVLDNFEQVLEAAPEVSALLASAPKLKIIVTSRAALQLRWEQVFPVSPLRLPDLTHLADAEVLAACPAVALFVERARAVRPDFRLGPHNARVIADICARLDGLPLAIELAAARVNVLPLPAILARLQPRLDLLTGGARDLPARHQTLREAIGWSHDLLTESEQALFSRMAVFVGGCTFEAAEAVGGEQGPEGGVLEDLASLVAKSLLRQEEQPDGTPRFRLLETIHEYALERLMEGGMPEVEAIRHRHAEYFLAVAERAEPQLWGAEQVAWAARIEHDLDNLRAAMAWSTGKTGEPQMGLRFAAALGRFWDLRGLLGEGRQWLSALLSLAPGRTPVRVKALNELSFLALLQGDAAATLPPLEEALAVARESGDELGFALSLTGRGAVAYLSGDLDRAAALLAESLALLRAAGRKTTLYNTLAWLSLVARARGEHEQAFALLEESLCLSREQGDHWGVAHMLLLQGQWAWHRGDYERGKLLAQESLAIRCNIGDRWGIAACMLELACMAAGRGAWLRAARLFGAAEAIREDIGAALIPGLQSDPTFAISSASATLGEAKFTAASAAGRAMSMDEAVDYALTALEPAPPAPSPSPSTAAQAPLLTPREREVAVLIAHGHTNQEIAAELVISRRTADAHVANILGKLDFTSRAQVAAWAAEQGLLHSLPPSA